MQCPRVRHAIFGEGIAIDQRHHGYEYLVRFPHAVQMWIKRSTLTFLGNEYPPEKGRAQSPGYGPQPPAAQPPKEARSVIEAFRMGIVPAQAIREWTVGRASEVEKVQQWLQDESSGTMVIRGEYGSGKSHLIEYLHASSFDLNYAVSLVGVDPCDAQPGFPKRIYRHLIRNLRFPYQEQYYTFCEIFTMLGKKVQENPLADQPFLGKVMERIKKERDTSGMWEWIEGQETEFGDFGTLYDHTTAANIYCNILSAIGMLAVRELGLRGILLMFDEAETSRTYRYYYEWQRALNFFNALSMVANDEHELQEEKVIKGEHYCYGERTGLIYSGYLPMPYIHQLPSFLKVVFAFTPDYKMKLSRDYNIYEIELEPLCGEHLGNLFFRFLDLYENVYRIAIPPAHRRRLFDLAKENGSLSTRRFIKAMVECLDYFRFYPLKGLEYLVTHVS